MDGWPTQARFWLEWGCSDLLNSVIPARADHRERNDLWSGEPALSLSKGTLYLSAAVFATMRQDVRTVVIESEWTPRKRERAMRSSVQLENCPTQAKTGLEWATRPVDIGGAENSEGWARPPGVCQVRIDHIALGALAPRITHHDKEEIRSAAWEQSSWLLPESRHKVCPTAAPGL